MRNILAALVIATLLFLSSCDLSNIKHDPKLPPITTEGNNTFGCLVNGEIFIPEAPAGYGSGVYGEWQSLTDTVGVNIYASNVTTKQTLIISIFDTPNLQVGKIYRLSKTNLTIDYVDYSKKPSCYYKTIIDANIKLLKFDLTNPQRKIIAGTFEYTMSSTDCMDTINTTEGRFDISDFQ